MIKPLTAIEASFLLEMIKTCQVLQREEYVGMVDSIVKATELNRRQSLEKMAEEYKKLDIGVSEDAMLKMLWDLLQCVVEQDKIRIHFKDKRKIELAPVFLWMYQDKIYLFAYKERTLNVYSLPRRWTGLHCLEASIRENCRRNFIKFPVNRYIKE